MIRTGLIVACVAASAGSALAHHGFGTFDLSKSVTYTGKLTRLEFINPHSWLYFEVTDAGGKVQKYRCEMRSAHTLRRSGWAAELFPMGQQVTIDANPDRNDPNSCYLNTIKFKDGSSMDRYGQYVKSDGKPQEVRGAVKTIDVSKRAARRPSGEPNISGDWAPEQVVMRDPRGTGGGLVPLSQIGERPDPAQQPQAGARAGGGAQAGGQAARGGGAQADGQAPRGGGGGAARGGGGGGGRGRGGVELTEVGVAAAAKNKQDLNPRFKCETTSILFDWTFDGPVNRITQNRDTIIIQYGQMNLRRTVFMRMKDHPANVKPSRAGHSIGRWEEDVLVVDTVNFLPGVVTGATPHGNKLHVVERFSLDAKTMRLSRQYTAEDPEYFKGQVTGQDVVSVADYPYTEDKCNDLQFVDYSKQQSSR
jgi:Family of unknown function (DUF6152)